MHYYPHHIGDFIRDTARLSDSQTMAYLRLMWTYYDTEASLPNDPKKLAFQIGASADDVQLILEHYFVLEADLWRHRRCDAEIAAFKGKKEKAAASANARWKAAKALPSDSERNANASKNDANQEPRTNNQEEEKPRKRSSSPVLLKTYIDECIASGVSPIPEGHAVRRYAESAGIEHELFALAWHRFASEHVDGSRNTKKYKDWPAAFANAVKDNWYKFWWRDESGAVQWTSQARLFQAAQEAQEE